MAVTSDEGVTRRYGGGGREVMVVEEVSLDDRTRAKRKQSGCYVVEEVEGGSGIGRSGSLFGFGFRVLLLGLFKL